MALVARTQTPDLRQACIRPRGSSVTGGSLGGRAKEKTGGGDAITSKHRLADGGGMVVVDGGDRESGLVVEGGRGSAASRSWADC